MKKVYRHKPLKKAAPKTRKKLVVKAAKTLTKSEERQFTHPLFNTRYQGMRYKYIRPFDSVWPEYDPANDDFWLPTMKG